MNHCSWASRSIFLHRVRCGTETKTFVLFFTVVKCYNMYLYFWFAVFFKLYYCSIFETVFLVFNGDERADWKHWDRRVTETSRRMGLLPNPIY